MMKIPLNKTIAKTHILDGAGLYLSSGGSVYIMKHFLFMSVHPQENKQ